MNEFIHTSDFGYNTMKETEHSVSLYISVVTKECNVMVKE
jgi:hypothetical protein